MHFKLSVAGIAAAFAATAIAVTHGELGEINGIQYRFQQLSPGHYTGIPANEWNSTVHKAGLEEWDIDAITGGLDTRERTSEMVARDLELEARNLASVCQAISNCARDYGGAATVTAAYNGYITVADYAANQAKTDLVNFLKSPFLRDVNTFTIVGVITGRINAAFSPANAECSTSSSEADVVGAAIAAAIAGNPDATEIAVTITGPTLSYTVDISVATQGTTPTTQCSS